MLLFYLSYTGYWSFALFKRLRNNRYPIQSSSLRGFIRAMLKPNACTYPRWTILQHVFYTLSVGRSFYETREMAWIMRECNTKTYLDYILYFNLYRHILNKMFLLPATLVVSYDV